MIKKTAYQFTPYHF